MEHGLHHVFRHGCRKQASRTSKMTLLPAHTSIATRRAKRAILEFSKITKNHLAGGRHDGLDGELESSVVQLLARLRVLQVLENTPTDFVAEGLK